MANPADETRVALIDRVVSYVLKKMPANELPLLKSFVTEYYRTVAPEELMSRSILDLYGAVMSFWEHINNKQKDEIKVNVYNPKLELHGWESGHTIIEIITDDIPFLMDSIRIELNKMDIHIHLSICSPGIKLKRDKQNKVMAIIEKDKIEPDVSIETAIYLEIDKQTDLVQLNYIKENLEKSLKDVVDSQKAIEAIESRLREDISDIENLTIISEIDKKENIDFLNWILNKHFVFMNFNKYLITTQFENNHYKLIEDEQLGVAHLANKVEYDFQLLSLDVQQLMHSNKVIILGKTDIKSTIHRAEYLDVIIVKKFNHNHELIAEHRYLGLFSANVYTNNPKIIPIIRLITRSILNNLAFSPKGCEYKILSNIIENLPRIDLFQITDTALLELCMGILNLQERPKIRLFAFKDNLGKFISCVVFVPRETYSSELGHKMQAVLLQGFLGHEIDFTTRFTESSLAQIHYVVKVESSLIAHNIKVIEQRLIEVARTWKDDLKDASLKHAGEEKGNFLLKIFSEAFPTSYQEDFSANMAVLDIDNIEGLTQSKPLGFSLYKPPEESNGIFRFKLFRKGKTIPLSDVLPMLENMGLRVISERPYPILPKGNGTVWINEYRVVYLKDLNLNVELIKDLFQDAFDNIWNNQAENDGFNRLVLEAKLTWREISLIRAFAKYLWQTGFIFAQNTIEDTFVNNPNIALKLIELFKLKFDPINQKNQSRLIDFKKQIIIALDAVSNLNEDKILRRFLDVIEACIRTNYFQKDENNQFKPYIALKFQSNLVPELPLPHPHVEIFVYSPKMEGIHLRGSKVARGGIRWSDRKDDYRTEILGLMKAQQVKNAVIVPLGAKGGFIVKTPLDNYDRESINNIVIEGYKTLISGLLDLTDNLTDNQIVSPSQLVCYDDNDPYLVVAADKGTASFSDIANNLSEKYHFWLKDAFASGGSSGYDHKKMGITAKGAWESVKRHFLELGIDTQNNDFTVVGIGDMSGDVFGNGMILSPHIKLLAAFNHLHIFLDPNPDPLISYHERLRLFKLNGSSWQDYDSQAISSGGGVYSRSLKSITLTHEVKNWLNIPDDKLTPSALIKEIIKSKADLLFNGGIGTYVKAATESDINVGDKTNDILRVNANELQVKVIGEGGNLGLTQLARVEFAKKGGRINTDAIDNSAGVNCSDNEVNIKILLNEVVAQGELTLKQRDELLVEMTPEVVDLVLNNNRAQNEAISSVAFLAKENLTMHARLIEDLERSGKIDRNLEFLPNKSKIANRKASNLGLTRPEIAVLMAYTKNLLKKDLLDSNLPEEAFIYYLLEESFPKILSTRFGPYLKTHRLKREIIATRLSNIVINEMGISFIYRLADETGAQSVDIVQAYIIARGVFDLVNLKKTINDLNNIVDANLQLKMVQEVNRLMRRVTRWFIRNRQNDKSIAQTIECFKPLMDELKFLLPDILIGTQREQFNTVCKQLQTQNVPDNLAQQIASLNSLFSSLDIIEAALIHHFPFKNLAILYFSLGDRIQLSWLRAQIKAQPINNHWDALARAGFRDDLDRLQRILTVNIILSNKNPQENLIQMIEQWLVEHPLLNDRWSYFIKELKACEEPDFTMYSVVLRELFDLLRKGEDFF